MAENPITKLLNIVQDNLQKSSELTIEIKALLNSVLNYMTSNVETDAKSEVKLDNISTSLREINQKLDGVQRANGNSIKVLLEEKFNKVLMETAKLGDKCSSDLCPRRDALVDLRKDKEELIKAYDSREKWWKKAIIALGVLVLVFAIGMILVSALGVEGLKMWFNQVTPKIKGF